MRTIKVRYQQGYFIPIEDMPPLVEGQEAIITLPDEQPDWEAYLEMLNKTQGMWADLGDDLQEAIDNARNMWDEEWLFFVDNK